MERSAEIEGVMRRFFRAMAAGDAKEVRAFSSREPGRRMIGTDLREWYSGDELEVLETQVAEYRAVGGMTIDIEDAEGYEEASVGWGAIRGTMQVGASGTLPIRVTFVFHLERGHWHVVQAHNSIAVSNEEALGVALTTSLDAVAAAVQSARPTVGAATAPDGTVTLLFTDIVGSTEVAERMGDERWSELLRWHRAQTSEAAEGCRGYVVKCLGDGFMLAFPSASDGIRCAATLQERTAVGWQGELVRLRAGLHSGDAVRDVDDFYGHAVTVAARVAAMAEGGEVLLTRVVADLARAGAFEFSGPRRVSLKGIEGDFEVVSLVTR
jgi:class 3 adenylate cyclase